MIYGITILSNHCRASSGSFSTFSRTIKRLVKLIRLVPSLFFKNIQSIIVVDDLPIGSD